MKYFTGLLLGAAFAQSEDFMKPQSSEVPKEFLDFGEDTGDKPKPPIVLHIDYEDYSITGSGQTMQVRSGMLPG